MQTKKMAKIIPDSAFVLIGFESLFLFLVFMEVGFRVG
jgi:hypothetical protein